MKMKPLLLAAVAAAATAALPILANAQFAKSEDAIRYRQSTLFVMGQHFGRIGAMVNDKMPFDAEAAKANARLVAQVSTMPWAAFVPGTEKGGNTKALPEVWTDPAKFESAQKRLQSVMPKLVAAADSGDKGQLKQMAGEVGAACKNCHDSFRGR